MLRSVRARLAVTGAAAPVASLRVVQARLSRKDGRPEPSLVASSSKGMVYLGEGESIEELLGKRLAAAADHRRRLCAVPAPKSDTVYRLIHGPSDGLPYCTVDVFGEASVTSWTNATMQSLLHAPLAKALHEYQLPPWVEASATLGTFYENGVAFRCPTGHDVTQRAARKIYAAVAEALPVSTRRVITVSAAVQGQVSNGATAQLLAAASGCQVTHLDANLDNIEHLRRNMAFAAVATDAVTMPSLNPLRYKASNIVSAESVGETIGTSRRFDLGVVDFGSVLRGGDLTAVTKDAVLALVRVVAARLVVGAHLAVWCSCVRETEARWFSRMLQSELTAARKGTSLRLRLVTELRPGADFAPVLAHPHAPQHQQPVDDVMQVTMQPAVDFSDGRTAEEPLGYLFHVD